MQQMGRGWTRTLRSGLSLDKQSALYKVSQQGATLFFHVLFGGVSASLDMDCGERG